MSRHLTVKSLLCNGPILHAPDFVLPFELLVDASHVGVGAALLQEGEDQVVHSVAFFSKMLMPVQRNYSVVEQKLLANLLAIQHFEVYLPVARWDSGITRP